MPRGSKKTKILNGALLVAVAGAGFGGYRALQGSGSTSSVTRTTATVTRGTVAQTVTATGNISALTSLDVNFDSGVSTNLVTEIDVKVGDKVTKGQVLAKVDDRVVQNNLAAARASLVSAQANYDKTKAGLTPEERVQTDASDQQAQVSLANAQTALDNAQANADQNKITTAESVRQAQQNFDNVKAQADRDLATPQANYDTAKANYDGPKATRDAALLQRDSDQAAVTAADVVVATLTADQQYCTANPGSPSSPDGQSCSAVAADLATAQSNRTVTGAKLTTSLNALNVAETALTPLTNALNTTTSALDAQKLKSKQSVDGATNSLTNAGNSQTSTATKDQQSIVSAQRALDSQNAAYNSTIAANTLKRKAPTAADMASQEVSLTNAKNSLFTAEKNAANAALVAPAAGTVSASNGRIGYAGSNTSGGAASTGGTSSNAFVSLADLSAFEVKVGFSETDAAKVKAGQAATVTLDAINARLSATVRSIDSISTLVSNVVTYYAYLSITQTNGVAVQPGMTASAAVTVDNRADVLFLPTSSVTSRGTNATVNFELGKDPKKTEVRQIVIGLRGDTALEVQSGLNEGDVVVTVRTKVSTAQNTTSNVGGTLTGNNTTGIPGVGVAGAGAAGGAGARTRTGG